MIKLIFVTIGLATAVIFLALVQLSPQTLVYANQANCNICLSVLGNNMTGNTTAFSEDIPSVNMTGYYPGLSHPSDPNYLNIP
jgi:hypothetical protein